MPNQSDIQQTILNGKYAKATLVNANLTLINQGNLPVKQSFINWFDLNLAGLIIQYSIGDYISAVTTTLYDRINYFVGIPYGATVDPNFQNPSIIIEEGGGSGFEPTILTFSDTNLLDAGGGNWYLPWTNAATPVSVTDNEVSFTFQYDESVVPARIYGFATNAPTQVIVVVAI